MRSRTTSARLRRSLLLATVLASTALAARTVHATRSETTPTAAPAVAPARLSETGLFADVAAGIVSEGVLAFTPQYPLWTDGARKRRWIRLPEGASIDATAPESWSFPVGTRVWKEFRFGARVETRYMERGADGWLYATYLWSEDGRDAVLAPDRGVRGACETGLGTRHDVPSVLDCRACHDASPSAVLGFSALQLAPERDPGAPHAEEPEPGSVDVLALLAQGRLRGSPAAILAAARPIEAASPLERSALGYLHANCGGCHNAAGPLASLGLELDYRHGDVAPARRSAFGRPSRFQPAGARDARRIEPGQPERSVLLQRMASRFAATQMPPLGTHAVDETALALVRAWICSEPVAPEVASAEPH